jgi:hypothetical protein
MMGKNTDTDNETKIYRKMFAVLVLTIVVITVFSYFIIHILSPSSGLEPPKIELSGTESVYYTFSLKIHDPDDLLRFDNVDFYIIDGDNVIFKSSFLELHNRNGDAHYLDADEDFRFSHADVLIIKNNFARPGLVLRAIYTPFDSVVFNYVLK